ncbi:MAG: hypothetical protein HDR87_08570 [Bacteroides sp.]|nr:hypothetical protein [Bacteroides sp.]MBD5362689.1 hypothetical protein [Bacteroides sp.]
MAKLNPAAALIIGLFTGCCLGRLRYASEETSPPAPRVITDTITITDTLLITQPAPKAQTIIRYVDARLPIAPVDSASNTPASADSANVTIPITQATFTDSTTYTAWVSGYNPRLDSLRLYPQTHTIHSLQTIAAPKPSRWALSIGAGIAATPAAGIQPAIFIGATYTLHPL